MLKLQKGEKANLYFTFLSQSLFKIMKMKELSSPDGRLLTFIK